LKDTIAMMLGGHAAEQEALEDITTGSSSDLKRATELCRRMVTQFGMSDALGTIYLGSDQEVFVGMEFGHTREYSEEVAYQIDKEVRHLLDESYEKARKILRDNIDKLHAVAAALLKHETLSRSEFLTVMEGKELPEPEPRPLRPEPDKAADKTEKPAAPKPDMRRILTGDQGGQI
jgi:cell division protease FtsH